MVDTVRLELDRVAKSYATASGTRTVLQDFSIAVPAGAVAWIRGASGSGKSTVIRIAGLLATPDSGRVVIEGVERVARAAASARVRAEQIGMVFQASNLLPEMTVGENLLVSKKLRTRQEALDQLERYGLADFVDAPAKTLSGGQLQRCAVCRALAGGARVILADEPTSGLDRANAETVRSMLRAAATEQGAAVLLASHDEASAEISDTTYQLEGGRLV